jgi:hypothetical protein
MVLAGRALLDEQPVAAEDEEALAEALMLSGIRQAVSDPWEPVVGI